ncbi:exodeoxyribonuclease-3 [Thermodesulfobium acidiphilum]|uniref:Exodeoxyribonuclease-3 n=1 Tax=Thermodesulfobium acidiphilum TaxID=1794699 RepID=A0A2R4W1H1_THEAF|nr:exodeoxyribonuclease III [Thermodesulfobium acidiphilum]AWB10528.1 exodeoxyribonuclease-3 [Thermodesulfobium acidiphilum]
MIITTFNVNSIRSRTDIVNLLIEKHNPEIIALQEIKCTLDLFPNLAFPDYKCLVSGEKSYNGVAICTKLDSSRFENEFQDTVNQKRSIFAKFENFTLMNIYFPHGDLRGTDKFYYKLDFYKKLLVFLKENFTPNDPIIMLGDFNVALTDFDVYDPEILKDTIGTMPEEREALKELLNYGFIDTYRHLHPNDPGFTWFSYIGGDIWKNNGMRIDYILVTKPLINKVKKVEVDISLRRRRIPKPSDHAPLVMEIDL